MVLHLSEGELDALAQELEAEIEALDTQIGAVPVSRHNPASLLPQKYRTQLEQTMGESANAFWPKLKRAAFHDICKPGGFIHDQWAQYNDVARKELAKRIATILAGMGMGSGNLLLMVVPVALWIFTALTHIGLDAFCDEVDTADT